MIKSMNLTLSHNKYSTALATVAIVIGVGAYWADVIKSQKGVATESLSTVRTVAWYVANITEAKAINRTCYHGKDPALTQESEDCQNALKALNMAHISQNYQN
jgi:hypothetical protein